MRAHWVITVLASILILGSLGFSQQDLSFPVGIGGAVDTPTCDTLDMPRGTYEELGTVHPLDELISAVDLGTTSLVACPATNGGSSPNVIVSMTNLTPHTWGDVWYFGDPGTALLNNVDGIDSGINLIFKIDSVGVNTPLISEDFIVDGKWQPGETWEFIIQGYSGIPGTAAEFSSLFVGTGSRQGPGPSTGSILALIDEGGPTQPPSVCVDPPSNLIGWWDGDSVSGITAVDIANGNDGTMLNGVTTVPGKVGNAFLFDGVDDTIRLSGTFGGTPEVTIDAWIKTNAVDPDFQAIVEPFGFNGPTGPVGFEFVHFQLNNFGGNNGFFTDGGPIFVSLPIISESPTEVYRHVAISIKSGDSNLYVDGNLVGHSSAVFSTVTPTTDLRIGSGFENRHFNGEIDEIEIFDRALTRAEIQSIFNAGSAGKCKAPPTPTLRIDKITNVDGTFDLTLTDGVSPNNGFINTDDGFGSNDGFVIAAETTYTLSETSPGEEWSTTISCDGSTAGPNGGSTFTANDVDSIVCTVTNTFTEPQEPPEPPEPEKNNPCDALDKASENGKGKKKGLDRAKANNNC